MAGITEQVDWKHECGVNAKARAVAEQEAYLLRTKVHEVEQRAQAADKDSRESDEAVRTLAKTIGQQGAEIRRLRAMVLMRTRALFAIDGDINFTAEQCARARRLLRSWASAIEAGRL